jgi:hypothetical protein
MDVKERFLAVGAGVGQDRDEPLVGEGTLLLGQ